MNISLVPFLEEQNSFKERTVFTDDTCNIRQIVEKCWELLFIDYAKAVDRINFLVLWYLLHTPSDTFH